MDLWVADHRLPLYQAALALAETFGLSLNREEEPVKRKRRTLCKIEGDWLLQTVEPHNQHGNVVARPQVLNSGSVHLG